MALFIIYLEPDEYSFHPKMLNEFLNDIECEFRRRGTDKRFRPYCVVETNGEINQQGLSKYPVDEVIQLDSE